MAKRRWYVKHFADYHEIESSTYKCVELGCWPVSAAGCSRYFGLFWKGKAPSREKILKSVLDKAANQPIGHYRTGVKIAITKEELQSELYLQIDNLIKEEKLA